MNARQVILRPVISEKSYALLAANKYVPRARALEQDSGTPGDRGDFRCARDGAPYGVGEAQAEAPRLDLEASGGVEEGGRDAAPGGLHRALRGTGDRGLGHGEAKHKPTTPGRRFATWLQHDAVTKTEPEKSLTEGLKKSGGRTSRDEITARHRGGGAKRRYRKIDFKRRKDGVPAKVAAIEYDPNRSAHIGLLHYSDGEKRYILAPARLSVGATVSSGDSPPATRCR